MEMLETLKTNKIVKNMWKRMKKSRLRQLKTQLKPKVKYQLQKRRLLSPKNLLCKNTTKLRVLIWLILPNQRLQSKRVTLMLNGSRKKNSLSFKRNRTWNSNKEITNKLWRETRAKPVLILTKLTLENSDSVLSQPLNNNLDTSNLEREVREITSLPSQLKISPLCDCTKELLQF